jgi:8-oxo-dGTP pyrophosphatase MutT (NUDIX family)
VADCRVFGVSRVRFDPGGGEVERTFYRIDAPHWINVIPLDEHGDVLFVRQYRFGIEDWTLEIPGGMCDRGESPADAAARELREETGHAAGRIEELGWVHPNPALQANRCYSYLARDLVVVGAPEPDDDEDFELVRVPLARVADRIADGTITNALVVAAFRLLDGRNRG